MKITEMVKKTHVIALEGRIDASLGIEMRQSFASLLDAGAQHIILDLQRATFLDSAGLAALVQLLIGAWERGGEVKVVLTPENNIQRMFQLTRFDRFFDLHTSMAAALQAA